MDYFTQFCHQWTVPWEVACWAKAYADRLEDICATFLFSCEVHGVEFWPDKRLLSISSEEYGDLDAAAHFIQQLLRRIDEDHSGLEWANTASRLTTDSCGGGCAYITRDKIEWIQTWLFSTGEYVLVKREEYERLKGENG